MAARTERRNIAPFPTAEGFVTQIKYRHSPSAEFREILGGPSQLLVQVDDLRTIPRHEFSVLTDPERLPAPYDKRPGALKLVVIGRDQALKQEHLLYECPADQVPASFLIDPKKLKETSFRKSLPLEFNLCSEEHGGPWPTRQWSRVASWECTIITEAKGPRFPWVRKTGEDFKSLGFPPSATHYLRLLSNPEDLITANDAPVEDLLEVWIHEDAWLAFQQSGVNDSISALQRIFVASVAVEILQLVATILRKQELEEDSVAHRLLSYVGQQSQSDPDQLKERLKTGGASEISPFAMTAFGINKAMLRVLE
jgi:hypothetical protein